MLKRVTKYTWVHGPTQVTAVPKTENLHVAGSADIRISWCNHDAAAIYKVDIILLWASSTLSTSKSNNQNSVCIDTSNYTYVHALKPSEQDTVTENIKNKVFCF